MHITGLLFRIAESFSLYFILLQIIGGGHDAVTVSGQETEPYLLFTTLRSVHRLYLNGTVYGRTLSAPNQFEIKKISYHYRLNYMFWIDSSFFDNRQIIRSRLDGSQREVLVSEDLGEPVDLAVDWLNDKLYWVDADLRQIEEYSLDTGVRRVVASTGAEGESRPSALALYPFPNYGWLYWSDTVSQSIQMVSVTGDGRQTFHSNTPCVTAMTVDYAFHTIYWIDMCTFLIESLRLDGDSSTHSFPLDASIFFPSGLTVYRDLLYWSASSGIFMGNTSVSNTVGVSVFTTRNTRATGVQVVHPSQQPGEREYEDIVATTPTDFTFQCSGECVHGRCIPPGLCACDAGWRGELCDTDILECSEDNGGCEHTCTDFGGGFMCSCRDGFVLTYDKRTCVEACVSSIVTVIGAPPATATFDPCLLYIRETSTSVLPSSSVKLTPTPSSSVREHITSTVAYTSSSSPTTTVLVVDRSTSSAVAKFSIREESSYQVHGSMYTEMTASSTVPTAVQVSPTSTVSKYTDTPTSEVILPSPDPNPGISDEEPTKAGLGLYIYIAIGGGAALIIATIIFIIILTCLIVRYKRRRNRSWSPQKPTKPNIYVERGVDSTSMKPVNGYQNGESSVMPKETEVVLDLDTKDFQETA